MGKGKVGGEQDMDSWIAAVPFLCFLFGFLHEQMEIGFWGDSEGEPANEGRRKREESLMRETGD